MSLLWKVNGYREDNQEEDIWIETVLVIKRVSHYHEPLYGNDDQPDNWHGDGDALGWVGEVRDDSVEPLMIAHGCMANNDIVNDIHEDQEAIYKC